jgi:hypothetical protein
MKRVIYKEFGNPADVLDLRPRTRLNWLPGKRGFRFYGPRSTHLM